MVRQAIPRSVLLVFTLLSFSTFRSSVRADLVISYPDPLGDTFGVGPVQHDITSIGSNLTATNLTLTVTFADPIFAPSAAESRSVVGFLDLDREIDFPALRYMHEDGLRPVVLSRPSPAKGRVWSAPGSVDT